MIVVYNFTHELDYLKQGLAEFEPVVLSESKDVSKTVTDWNNGEIRVLLLHPASGGHGLNLQQGGSTMVWFGLTFSFEQYAQTCARINRQGQERPVVIHSLIATGTVDEVLENALQSKEEGQSALFDYLKEYRNTRAAA